MLILVILHQNHLSVFEGWVLLLRRAFQSNESLHLLRRNTNFTCYSVTFSSHFARVLRVLAIYPFPLRAL